MSLMNSWDIYLAAILKPNLLNESVNIILEHSRSRDAPRYTYRTYRVIFQRGDIFQISLFHFYSFIWVWLSFPGFFIRPEHIYLLPIITLANYCPSSAASNSTIFSRAVFSSFSGVESSIIPPFN